MRKFLYIFLGFVIALQATAQINMSNQAPYNTAQYLVNDVFSGGNVTINNIQVFGNARQYGFFDGGMSSIGIDSGIVLSTGNINELCGSGTCNVTGANASGNGNGTNFGPAWMGTPNSNALLDVSNLAATLIPGAGSASDINDACVIWFEFEPTLDTMQFDFVFASAEWPTFPCSSFNDVFGFFVSGPGITGTYAAPPGFTNSENYALVPGTSTPITISSINGPGNTGSCPGPTNQQFFINNTNNAQISINAYTTVLTVEFPVVPCQTYSFAMAIGDASDGGLSSHVFMAANSFQASGVQIIPSPNVTTQGGDSILFEGCGSVDIDFVRLDNVANGDTIGLSIGGSATNGVDYSSIADSIVFLPGQDSVNISFTVFEDFITEGTEQIVIGISDSTISLACGTSGDSIILDVEERVQLNMDYTSHDTVTCLQTSHLFEAVLDTGMLPATYQWSTGDTTPTFNYNGTFVNDTAFAVTVTGACGVDSIVDSAYITVQNPPTSISCTGDTITCEDNGLIITVQTQNAMAGMNYQWSNGQTGSAFFQPNPYVTTDYVVTATQSCAGYVLIDTFTLVVDNPPFVTSTTDDTVTCIDPPLDINVNVTNTTPGFTYQWNNGVTDSVQTVNPVVTTDYYVTVTDACGQNQGVDTVRVWVINDPITLSGQNASIDCVGDTAQLTVDISGGYQPYSVLWSNGETDTTIDVTSDSNAIYTVSVTDVCELDTVDINMSVFVRTYPDLQIFPYQDLIFNCPGIPFEFGPVQVSGGTGDYIVSWTDWQDQINYLGSSVDTTTTFTVEVADLCNLDSASSQVTVLVREHPPLRAVVSPDTFACPADVTELWAYPVGGGGNYSYAWSNGETDSINEVAPLSPQQYTVTITDDCGETASKSTFIEVSAPEAIFSHEHIDAVNVIFANASERASSYYWDFGDGNSSTEEDPWHTYETGSDWYVKLFAYDDQGCVDSTFAILDPPLRVYIPSGFTPNGDELNDVFKIYGEGFKSDDQIKSFLVVIFDRWGNEVFSSRESDFEWDGTYDGEPAAVGTYVYKIRMEGYSRQKYEKTGNITIPSYMTR